MILNTTKIGAAFLILTTLTGCGAPVIFAGGAAAGAAAVTDRRTAGMMVEDQAIEVKIGEAIYSDDTLKENVHISATSFNGIVLLTGEAADSSLRRKAAWTAQQVERVRKIYNEVVISPPSSLQSRAEDTWITTKVKAGLVANKDIHAINIKVVTENKTVYLMGLVSRDEGGTAANIARKVDGVKQVVKLFEHQ